MFKLNKYIRDTKGSLTVVFGFSLSVIVIGIGVAIDLSGMVTTSQDTQQLADMAVLAAVASEKKTPWELEDIAKRVVSANASDPEAFSTTLTLHENRYIQVDVQKHHEFLFMPAFGYQDRMVSSSATGAPIGIGKLDIALVLDITDTTTGGLVNGLAGDVNELIDTVDNEVADTLGVGVFELVESYTDVKFSVVPFSQYVKIPESYASDPWLNINDEDTWQGCVGSRNAPWNKRPEYSSAEFEGFSSGGTCEGDIQPLTTSLSDVTDAILAVNSNENLYLPAGLMWGWRTLSRDVPFTEADTTDYFERKRVMLLVSDGGNLKSMSGGNDDYDGNYHNGDSNFGSRKLTKDICDDIKDDGIIIYSAAIEVEDNTLVDLLQYCATDPLTFVNAADDIAIDLLFGHLREDMSQVRLSH